MDFRRKSRQRKEIKPIYEDLEQRYPQNIALYSFPPTEDIKIQEFEDLALERLKVLRILENAVSKGLHLLSEEWKEYVNGELTQEGLKGYLRMCTPTVTNTTKHESDLQARRRDYISHFILRLAYCRTAELKRWFLTREMELFKYKFSALNGQEIKQFLEQHKMNYTSLTEAEKDAVKDGLYESTVGQSIAKIELLDFYKVPFTQVPDLIRARRCYLKNGYAYVNTQDFVSIVSVKHLNEIEHGLHSAQVLIREVESDERLFYLLKSLHTTYTGKDYTINRNEVTVPIESLDQLSKKSYPLCMRNCHEHLRANHHLKHGGRMQYGLFLKGIGVSLEDAVRFWREEFTKKMDVEKFTKSYEYNIYHNYGKRGSMVNYTPYSCTKIIQENVAAGDVHGCPYRLFDQSTLKLKLTANGLSAAHVQEVMALVTKGHYQLACGKYFQIIHDTPNDVAITHPNQYFEDSQILMGQRIEKKNEKYGQNQRKAMKRTNNGTLAINRNANDNDDDDDDDELWNIAEKQENEYKSQEAEKTAWDDDLDLTKIEY